VHCRTFGEFLSRHWPKPFPRPRKGKVDASVSATATVERHLFKIYLFAAGPHPNRELPRSPMYTLDHPISPAEAIVLEIGDDPPPEVQERLRSGLCIECGCEPAIDGLYGARCIEDTQNEHRRARW
jgi:hypothetical protein